MEMLIEILRQIRKYSEWVDRDTIEELRLYLDEIRDLTIDAIDIEDEKKSNERVIIVDNDKIAENRELLKKQVKFVKEAMAVYESHPF